MTSEEKTNENGEFFELEELVDVMVSNIKEDIKDFTDLISLDGSLRREVYLSDINCGTGAVIEGQIRFWNQQDADKNVPVDEREPIKLYIDSGGGSLDDALTIVDSIKLSKTPIITINSGKAYSGAFLIFIAGHKRMAYPHASFLFHEGSVTGAGGDAAKFRNFTEFYDKQLEQLKQIILSNTNMTEEYYKEHHKDDIWLTAEDAKELNACDEILTEFFV